MCCNRVKKILGSIKKFFKWLLLITPVEKVAVPERETVRLSLIKQQDDKAIDLYYKEVFSRLDYDMGCIDSLDNKASIFVGVVGTLLAVLGAITFMNAGGWFKTFCIIAVGFFLIAVIFAISSYRPRKFQRSPHPYKLIAGSCDDDIKAIKRDIICNWVKDYSMNKQILLQKYYDLEHSAVFVSIGIIFLAISVAIKIAGS